MEPGEVSSSVACERVLDNKQLNLLDIGILGMANSPSSPHSVRLPLPSDLAPCKTRMSQLTLVQLLDASPILIMQFQTRISSCSLHGWMSFSRKPRWVSQVGPVRIIKFMGADVKGWLEQQEESQVSAFSSRKNSLISWEHKVLLNYINVVFKTIHLHLTCQPSSCSCIICWRKIAVLRFFSSLWAVKAPCHLRFQLLSFATILQG